MNEFLTNQELHIYNVNKVSVNSFVYRIIKLQQAQQIIDIILLKVSYILNLGIIISKAVILYLIKISLVYLFL